MKAETLPSIYRNRHCVPGRSPIPEKDQSCRKRREFSPNKTWFRDGSGAVLGEFCMDYDFVALSSRLRSMLRNENVFEVIQSLAQTSCDTCTMCQSFCFGEISRIIRYFFGKKLFSHIKDFRREAQKPLRLLSKKSADRIFVARHLINSTMKSEIEFFGKLKEPTSSVYEIIKLIIDHREKLHPQHPSRTE